MPENWTGERLETFIYSDVTIEHLHRYAIALQYAASKTVLDIACGEGYGSHLLASIAKQVTGVDISEKTIAAAKLKYQLDNLEFLSGSTSAIPAPDNYFDMVVSFETIEHHDEHEKMMHEIKRVLKNDGVLIISSPEKKMYSDKRNYKNPFHVKELYFEEFKILISSFFLDAQYFFQNNIASSLIIPENLPVGQTRFFNGSYESIYEETFSPMYILCMASDGPLPATEISFFNALEIQQSLLQEQIHIAGEKRTKETAKTYEQSFSFRAGRVFTFPFRWMRKIILKK
jgi:ubiquinone/menaquinone biosynthesis C-methylase UbiE